MENLPKFDWTSLMPIAVNLLSGFGIFILGWILSGWAYRTIMSRLGNERGLQVSATIRPLIATSVKYAILLGALYAGLTQAGVAASSLLAVFGAAGLAIALAVQGTLSNIAAGIMLIFLRSMKVGEFIETPNISGTVLEIGLFTTHIRRGDGVFVTVPNAQIWSSQITNYSRFDERRIDIDIAIARDNDLAAAIAVLEATIADHPLVVDPDLTNVTILNTTPHTVILQTRCWVARTSFRADSSTLRLVLHEALRSQGFKLPKTFPINEV
ncbi:MAG: mechanosensitive ion channel family protein [Acidimicrobiales bacterium]|nr:mechanosensitive ion channel family protein [Hyphomonadaceae bacterium]RZV44689.1 MAG: mechanosensitive ion channel family protein [Acidimicrobiales bacterium]